MFLLVKGLYPGGGYDYYKHYFQFYKRVVETGSVLPNDVWYHFYYSKGAGLYFLGMLLTDPLAPQLVATAFMACGGCIVYALLYRACHSKLLPLTGVLLYIGALIPTGSSVVLGEHRRWEGRVEWGILERLHELTAVLLLAVIWIAYRLFREEVSGRGMWVFALHASIITVVLLTLPLALLIGLFMAGYLLWFALTRQWHLMLQPLGAGITAGLSLFAIAAVNYHYTGFPSDIVLERFWPYADLMKIMHWGTMLEILTLYQNGPYLVVAAQPISWNLIMDLAVFLRFNVWWPIFLAAAPFISLLIISKSARRWLHARDIDPYAWGALGWFSAAVILVAILGGGRSEPISFYRMSTFSYAPTLCLGLLLCQRGLPKAANDKKRRMLGFVSISGMLTLALGALLVSSSATISTMRRNVSAGLDDAARLFVGRFSLLDAYQNQPDGPAPWGAIYPGIIEPWRIAGPETPIWSFNVLSYCMLPDCNVQTFLTERFSPSWQVVFFGQPEEAIKALQAEGRNYFFFSSELVVADLLPELQLFSPATIGKYLAIGWTDGTSYLLTWPGPNTKPIDQKFLFAYTRAVKTNYRSFDLNLLKSISDYIDRHREDLRPFKLPGCTNCDGLPSIG